MEGEGFNSGNSDKNKKCGNKTFGMENAQKKEEKINMFDNNIILVKDWWKPSSLYSLDDIPSIFCAMQF